MIVMKDPNAKDKPTTLKDDAAIYQKREPKTERQKFSEMKTWSDKANYFRAYYLKPTLAGICIFVLAVYFLYTVLSPKEQCLLRVAFVDYAFAPAVTDEMKETFLNDAEITLKEHEIMEFNGTTYQLRNAYDYSSRSVLSTHIMAKELDIFIAPESTFYAYSENGTVCSLTELLPSDVYSSLSDRFFLFQNAEDGQEQVLGIYLDDTPFWDRYGQLVDPNERPIIGIVANSQHKEMATDYIRYLFRPSSH